MVLSVAFPTPRVGRREPSKVDIVAVHGLNGDATRSWTSRISGAYWIVDFLPLDIPGARVMTFEYDADAAFGNSAAGVLNHAKELLSGLADKREEAELQRPIIFIAHSFGGIVVKQALVQASVETRYKNICERTVGIIFFGTPHQGSGVAGYGEVLTRVAASVVREPSTQFVRALRANSGQLTQLTEEFRLRLPKCPVVSFYELRPMRGAFSVVVEKDSALLGVNAEDQIPVDANHREMCKFESRDDDAYENLCKRVRRLLAVSAIGPVGTSRSLNMHYRVPHGVSPIFTGRGDTCRQLEQLCLPPEAPNDSRAQKRFVVYGMGGSGKTQVCLKFAQDHRGKFWGVFWIDASRTEIAEQGFLDIARACGQEEEFEATKTWMSSIQYPWLLIIDNADDPAMDISKYFPMGNRGAVLVATRNPDFKIYATVGSIELGRMRVGDAITLLLKSTTTYDVLDQASRDLAKPVVEALGHLALAITQAGAAIKQKNCTIESYGLIYSRRRKQLLSGQAVQAQTDYKYTVYTTWEVCVSMIQETPGKTAQNAIEVLRFLSFLHFNGISEEIFREAWEKFRVGGVEELSRWVELNRFCMLRPERLQDWDPRPFRQAIALLSSFSLVTIDDAEDRISIHPLVHAWARHRLIEEEQRKCWAGTALTLAMSVKRGRDIISTRFRRFLLPHIGSCLHFNQENAYLADDPLGLLIIFPEFASAYFQAGRPNEALALCEKVVEVSGVTLGEEHDFTLRSKCELMECYNDLGRVQEAAELGDEVVEAQIRILGWEHHNTLASVRTLAVSNALLGRDRESIDGHSTVLEARRRTLGEEHPHTLHSMHDLAITYGGSDLVQEAVELDEVVLKAWKGTLGEEHPDTVDLMRGLAISYNSLGRMQDVVELDEVVLKAKRKALGEEHPDTLISMHDLAVTYGGLGRIQEGAELYEAALEVRRRVLGQEHPDTLKLMHNLAVCYDILGRIQEAAELHGVVLEARRRVLGGEHPHTVVSMCSLAISYDHLGRIQDAVELRDTVQAAKEKIFDQGHPDAQTVASYDGLDYILEAVEENKGVLVEDYPDSLPYRGNPRDKLNAPPKATPSNKDRRRPRGFIDALLNPYKNKRPY
ncbi:MAG: hypothetical protein M1839_005787 [Geoglossum umbratile]|nr:MAG: hypothetical protein M1839_005787 [Geoglossum umbratile]